GDLPAQGVGEHGRVAVEDELGPADEVRRRGPDEAGRAEPGVVRDAAEGDVAVAPARPVEVPAPPAGDVAGLHGARLAGERPGHAETPEHLALDEVRPPTLARALG